MFTSRSYSNKLFARNDNYQTSTEDGFISRIDIVLDMWLCTLKVDYK